jgi:hypothetical protein
MVELARPSSAAAYAASVNWFASFASANAVHQLSMQLKLASGRFVKSKSPLKSVCSLDLGNSTQYCGYQNKNAVLA